MNYFKGETTSQILRCLFLHQNWETNKNPNKETKKTKLKKTPKTKQKIEKFSLLKIVFEKKNELPFLWKPNHLVTFFSVQRVLKWNRILKTAKTWLGQVKYLPTATMGAYKLGKSILNMLLNYWTIGKCGIYEGLCSLWCTTGSNGHCN